jgi:hypothetical protein
MHHIGTALGLPTGTPWCFLGAPFKTLQLGFGLNCLALAEYSWHLIAKMRLVGSYWRVVQRDSSTPRCAALTHRFWGTTPCQESVVGETDGSEEC